jgi:AcrR family transcriptional regulator
LTSELRVRAPKPTRRSHTERTAETRRRVTAAVVECIAELGFQRTTGTEIARRAGVTWGAVQHHFGDKNGILAAVLEESFHRFAATLGRPDPVDAPLESRVTDFIDRAWEHFRGPHYRTTFEILLNLPPEMESTWALGVLGTWQEIWRQYFPESPLDERETGDLMRYAVSVLSGLATTNILEGRSGRGAGRSLARLKDTLLRELRPGSRGASESPET